MALCDRDIREALHHRYLQDYHADPSTLILDELGICNGSARADIAIINGSLNGIEIKSERDTLARLESQADAYNRVFDTITLVVGPKHTDELLAKTQEWWGLIEVDDEGSQVEFYTIREPSLNPNVDPYAVAQLLWKSEALRILSERGLAKGYRSKTCKAIWGHMAESIPLAELQHLVREAIKARVGWRVDG